MAHSSLDNLSYTACLESLQTRFTISPGTGNAINLTLVEVTRHAYENESLDSAKPRTESMSLVLLGPQHPVLPQQTYELSHERFGCLPLFMVPLGKDAKGVRYEVVINRFVMPPAQ